MKLYTMIEQLTRDLQRIDNYSITARAIAEEKAKLEHLKNELENAISFEELKSVIQKKSAYFVNTGEVLKTVNLYKTSPKTWLFFQNNKFAIKLQKAKESAKAQIKAVDSDIKLKAIISELVELQSNASILRLVDIMEHPMSNANKLLASIATSNRKHAQKVENFKWKPSISTLNNVIDEAQSFFKTVVEFQNALIANKTKVLTSPGSLLTARQRNEFNAWKSEHYSVELASHDIDDAMFMAAFLASNIEFREVEYTYPTEEIGNGTVVHGYCENKVEQPASDFSNYEDTSSRNLSTPLQESSSRYEAPAYYESPSRHEAPSYTRESSNYGNDYSDRGHSPSWGGGSDSYDGGSSSGGDGGGGD